MLARPLAAASQMLTVGTDLLLQRYPAALYRPIALAEELPAVFCFHSAEPEAFEAVLGFLARNGYRTLIADEFRDLMRRGEGVDAARAVLLTFDDGMGQLWSVAYPLLKTYGMRATCFLIPGRIPEIPRGDIRPNLEDVWQGRATLAETMRDFGDRPLATWEEIAIMHESGVIDFQSHSWDHRLVVTSPHIVDFVSPRALSRFHPFEFSMFRDDEAGPTGPFDRPELGSPIYTTAPRLAAARRFLPDPAIGALCVEHVAKHGGEAFFEHAGWRRQLFNLLHDDGRNNRRHGTYESEDARRAALIADLARAKAAIEAHLPGQGVRHLAFPWGEGSAAAIDAARATGHEACFWNKVDGRLVNRMGSDPFRIARIGEDFARSLPGEGRVPLRQVITRKLRRRLRDWSPYLSH
jgi:peptidoglycan/xylan/chitin deacetylase (PgdA/CDA1 family)